MKGFFSRNKSHLYPPARKFRHFLDWPRHRPIHIRLKGRDFHAPDPLSFYWSYLEIMEERIYDFPDTGNAQRIVDLGANTGLASLFFLERFPHAEITAVEADPSLFRLLEKNTSGWEPPRLKRICAAVAQNPGTQWFSAAGADAGRLNPSGESLGSIPVPGHTLDSFLEHPVDLLKIDIEGAETDCLLSAQRLGHAERIFVEYHRLASEPQRLDKLLEKLASSGFRYFVQEQFCAKHPFRKIETNTGFDLQLNIFASRKPTDP